MFNKYRIANYIISVVTFVIQLTFLILALVINYLFLVGLGAFWALAAVYGGWIQWIGAKYHHADSDTITAGLGLEMPLAQFLTVYFTYRFTKDLMLKEQKEQEVIEAQKAAEKEKAEKAKKKPVKKTITKKK